MSEEGADRVEIFSDDDHDDFYADFLRIFCKFMRILLALFGKN